MLGELILLSRGLKGKVFGVYGPPGGGKTVLLKYIQNNLGGSFIPLVFIGEALSEGQEKYIYELIEKERSETVLIDDLDVLNRARKILMLIKRKAVAENRTFFVSFGGGLSDTNSQKVFFDVILSVSSWDNKIRVKIEKNRFGVSGSEFFARIEGGSLDFLIDPPTSWQEEIEVDF